MARVYREGDIGNEITTRRVAILGYGSQGHAHALNLKESGCDVRVGLYEGSKSWPKAEGDGLQVQTIADAVREADVVMMLLPDEKQPAVFDAEVGANLSEGDLMLLPTASTSTSTRSSSPPKSTWVSSPPKDQDTCSGVSMSRAKGCLRSSRSRMTLRGRLGM